MQDLPPPWIRPYAPPSWWQLVQCPGLRIVETELGASIGERNEQVLTERSLASEQIRTVFGLVVPNQIT
mgnify:CR=1 FL=1